MRRKILLVVAVTLAVIGLDQASKFWVVKDLTHGFLGDTTVSQKLGTMYSHPLHHQGGTFFLSKRAVTVIPGFFDLRYAENTGVAFGMFRDQPASRRAPFFYLITLIAVGVILYMFLQTLRSPRPETLSLAGLALILGGALGNFIDRVARGFVVDFFYAYVRLGGQVHPWPNFNVADSAICVGAALLVLESLLVRRSKQVTASA